MSSKPERKVLRLVHTDRKPDFIFLAHWVETWNWLLKFVHELHRNPQHARRWMWLWPVYAVVSLVYLFRRTAYSLVDRFIFEGEVGETMLLTNFGWHFALRRLQLLIRRRILQAVLAAEVRGAKVIGLGALTKAEWLTEGGAWITRAIPNLKARIVHGDTLTAAVVIRQALQLIKRFSLNIWPVFITGATSKIGRAVTLLLLQQDIRVIMFTESDERFEEMKAEAGKNGRLLERAVSLEDGRSCLFWITGKAFPDGKTILRHLPQDGIVLNFSVPDPLSPRLLRHRQDVRHFDGGLIGYKRERLPIEFTMRLTHGLTYACHAGTMVHALKRWRWHEVGPVDLNRVDEVWKAAKNLGFFLPDYTSFLRPAGLPAQSYLES